jgi:hypothetical protein
MNTPVPTVPELEFEITEPAEFPLIIQLKDKVSPFSSLAVAEKVFGTPTPVRTVEEVEGVCPAQRGGAFLTTIQVRVMALLPVPMVATRTLLPEFRMELRTCFVVSVPDNGTPFNVQLATHPGVLVVMAKLV